MNDKLQIELARHDALAQAIADGRIVPLGADSYDPSQPRDESGEWAASGGAKATEMRLQYQTSSGQWVDAYTPGDDRTEEFLTLLEKNNGRDADGRIVSISRATRPLTRAEVLAALAGGEKLRNDPSDWYSVSRYRPVSTDTARPAVPASPMMSTSSGPASPADYDRKSGG